LFIWNTGGEHRHEPLAPDDLSEFAQPALQWGASVEQLKVFNAAYAKFGFNSYLMERHIALNGKYPGKEWGVVGDGQHSTTRKGEALVGIDDEEVKSQGVVFRNWHPGPLGLQAVADASSYFYLRAFVDAVDRIVSAANDGHDPTQLWPLHEPDVVIPYPVHAGVSGRPLTDFIVATSKPNYIVLNKEAPSFNEAELFTALLSMQTFPSCVSYESPIFGRQGLQAIPNGLRDNPYAEDFTKNKYKGWKVVQGPRTELIPAKDRSRPECAMADRCGGIVDETGEGGWVVYRLPDMEIGFIIVCFDPTNCGGNPYSEELKKEHREKDFEFEFDRIPLTPSYHLQDKCVVVQSKFPNASYETRKDALYFAARRKGDGCIAISQIMAG
jgi:hypothetical protein